MQLIRDKIFFGIIAFTIFAVVTFFISQLDPKDGTPDYIDISSAYLIFYNAVILPIWILFGWIAGAISLLASIIIATFLLATTGARVYYLHVLLFLAAAYFAHGYSSKIVDFQTAMFLKGQKIEEDKNTLSERIERDKAHMEALKLKHERYEELKNVAEYLSDIFSSERIAKFLAERSLEIIGKSTRSMVYLVNPNTQELLLTYSKQPDDFPKIKTKKGDMFDKWVVRQNQPLIVLDVARDFRFPQEDAAAEDFNFKALIAVPMVSHNKTIGLLRLDSQTRDIYNPDDLRLLDIIADLGAVSLHNNMLYHRTTELAVRDGLTQLFVHRYFMERLGAEVQRGLKMNHPLSILMIDIDNFKNYNDQYGHIAGDILLKRLSKIFVSIVGKGDIPARYGGEEFSILLFGEGKKGSKKIAEKIRKAVEKDVFYLRRERTYATISIGVSVFPDDAKTPEDLLKIADKNLYLAKKSGKNKVCMI